jgi:hypothetical protein
LAVGQGLASRAACATSPGAAPAASSRHASEIGLCSRVGELAEPCADSVGLARILDDVQDIAGQDAPYWQQMLSRLVVERRRFASLNGD